MLRVTGEGIVNYSYVLYLKGSHEAILVDPAWDEKTIEVCLERCRIGLGSILLTHHHRDHVNKAEELANKYNVNVYISQTEISRYGFKCKNLVGMNAGRLNLGDVQVEVIATPGHTQGSVCYQIGSNLLTGDTLFIEGCGLCNESIHSTKDMFSSLSLLKETISDSTRVYPGHRFRMRPGVKMKDVRKFNPYLSLSSQDFQHLMSLRQYDRARFSYM